MIKCLKINFLSVKSATYVMESNIVIVGGGIIGCSTAYYLTKLGHTKVTLIEAVEVAHAASGRAGGFLALDWCDGQRTGALARRSYHLHQQLAESLGQDCGYRPMRTLSLEVRDKRAGVKKVKDSPEWIDGEVKNQSVIGTEASTAQVHPRLLTRALLAEAERAGARLVRAEVTGGQMEAGAVTGVSLASGEIVKAEVVVLCMGPWTGLGLQWFGLRGSVIDGHRAHSITMELDGPSTIDNTALFLSNLKSPEVYPRPDGTVYMCGGCSSDHAPLPAHPADVKVDEAACDQIKVSAGLVSDQLALVSRYTRSACYLPHSEDGAPVMGRVSRVSGLHVAAGHSCWGILQGPATGEAMAELLLGKTSHLDISPFDPDRFFD